MRKRNPCPAKGGGDAPAAARGEHPETGWALVALGRALLDEKKLDEAERTEREALGIFRKQYSSGHISVDAVTSDLKSILEVKGDLAGFVALDQTILADQRSAYGEDSPVVADTLYRLGDLLKSQNRPEEAVEKYRESLDIF